MSSWQTKKLTNLKLHSRAYTTVQEREAFTALAKRESRLHVVVLLLSSELNQTITPASLYTT